MLLSELSDYIESVLEVSRFRDYCPNGVQVEGRSEIRKIASGVTASQRFLDAAVEWGADAVVVHHGYFWRGENAPITGMKKRRIAQLLKHDISLLAYHLPLDAHPELGNNAQLAARLGFKETTRFGDQNLACLGELTQPQTLDELLASISGVLQREPLALGNRSTKIQTVAWCTGAAQDYHEQAVALGADVFLTGEVSERNAHITDETGVAFIAAGHHATERYGVQALGEHLAAQWGLQHQFLDVDNPI